MVKFKSTAVVTALGVIAGLSGVGFAPAQPAVTKPPPRILSVSGDVVSANEGCILTSQFERGSLVVFRAQVHTQAGKPAAGTDKVMVRLSNGISIPMEYIQHPLPGKPKYWVGVWLVPMNEKLGAISYTIVATNPKTGVAGSFAPIPDPGTFPTVVPFSYTTTLKAMVHGRAAELVRAGNVVNLAAAVEQPVEVKGKVEMKPLTQGTVFAKFGMAGDVTATGTLKPSLSVNLKYQASTKTWRASLPIPAVLPGMYEIQISGHDAFGNLVSAGPIYVGVEGRVSRAPSLQK